MQGKELPEFAGTWASAEVSGQGWSYTRQVNLPSDYNVQPVSAVVTTRTIY